jgi:hypothetical protein
VSLDREWIRGLRAGVFAVRRGDRYLRGCDGSRLSDGRQEQGIDYGDGVVNADGRV